MAADRPAGLMSLYQEQLDKAGIDVCVLPVDCDMSAGGRTADKIRGIRKFAHLFSDYKYLIISDCCDITFWGTHGGLMARLDAIPEGKVLWAAEKNCYPDPSLSEHINIPGPWKHLNAGLSAGTPQAYLDICLQMESHPTYTSMEIDQALLNRMLVDGLLEIDHRTHLFFCMFIGYDELGFVNGEPVNKLYDTWPIFLHSNGHAPTDEMFRRHKESLGG